MKKIMLFVLVVPTLLKAQDFSGMRTSNYTGVSGVFYNPANIADSRHRWDFNLFGLSTSIANNKASFRLKDIGRSLDGDSIKNKIFSESSGSSSGAASVVLQGPSISFNLNEKSAIAITSRARVMSNVIDIDGKLAQQLIDDAQETTGFPYTLSTNNNMIVNANGWAEFGVSYAREIYSSGNHYIKGGVTLKYLAGAANASININRLNTVIGLDVVRNDSYLNNSQGKIGLTFGGIDISDIKADDLLSFKSTGIGADIGFVYEYRPDAGNYKDATGAWQRDVNKYKFKIGVALLDIGSIKYSRDARRSGTYDIRISNAQRFYLSSLSNAELDDFKDTLARYPQFFVPDATANNSNYTVPLPTTIHINADYHIHKGFYVNLATQLSLLDSRKKIYSSQYYNTVALTPRIESKSFGLYVPVQYNSLSNITAGVSVRLGSFFIGSGSVLSAALGDSKGADVFIGLHFGSLQKKK